MPEYHSMRFLLAILQFWLAFTIWNKRIGSLLIFGVLCWADATAALMPMQAHNPAWWRYAWLPLAYVRLALAIGSSFEIFLFLYPWTYTEERWLIATISVCIGASLAVAGMFWNPANWFQVLVTLRQYVLLMLAGATASAWAWVRMLEPSGTPTRLERSHGLLWCIWLWVLFGMSSTGAGGLARLIGDWNGSQLWRWTNDVFLVLQLVLTGLWLKSLSLRQSRAYAQAA